MAKRCEKSCWWRVAAIVAASLCLTTLALPFSPVRRPHRVNLISETKITPVTVKQDSALATKPAEDSLPQFADLDARLQFEYGAVLKARNGVALPPHEMFSSDEEVAQWQANVKTRVEDMSCKPQPLKH